MSLFWISWALRCSLTKHSVVKKKESLFMLKICLNLHTDFKTWWWIFKGIFQYMNMIKVFEYNKDQTKKSHLVI